ncbi:unnamed protein product, partial [Discosporangium mesarthrocarpum]
MYIREGSPPQPGTIQKVHWEAGDPPFYTVAITASGQEKNTDHLHLRKELP